MTIAEQPGLNPLRGGELTEGQSDTPHPCQCLTRCFPGSPLLSVSRTSAAAAELLQSCPTPSDPTDCSLPGSSAHGIGQARVSQTVKTGKNLVIRESLLFPHHFCGIFLLFIYRKENTGDYAGRFIYAQSSCFLEALKYIPYYSKK